MGLWIVKMKTTFCILASIVTVYCLPNPESYKESGISGAGSDSGYQNVKRSFSSFDFDSPSKLEYSETSAVAGHSDVGPKDVAAELHAKIEEAAQHALAIIDGAKTFAESRERTGCQARTNEILIASECGDNETKTDNNE